MRAITPRAMLCIALAMFMAGAAAAQSYPSKPIRMIVPWNPGGTSDTSARIIGLKMTEAWGQQVVIDTRAGASGIIGTEVAMRAPADGYTLLHANMSQFATNPFLYKVSYDTLRDFAPISMVASAPQLLVVHPGVAAKSVQELIQLARAKPGSLNFGSGGAGTIAYPAGEMFKTMTGVKLTHVPYKGTILALNDLLGGRLEIVFSDMPIALPHARSGKARALAVTSAQRSALLPDMPTVAEQGVAGYAIDNSWGMFARRGTPPPIIARLNTEMVRIHALPDVRERYANLGLEAVTSTPEGFRKIIETETEKFGKIIKATGARVD